MDLMADDIRNIVNLSGAPLEEAFAKQIFKQMVEAVAHCHRNNIVHRDIKLENFLLNINEETQKIYVKLTDFGISRKMKPGKMMCGCKGTLYTMAPEIISDKLYDQTCDVWSLGVVLFELLTN